MSEALVVVPEVELFPRNIYVAAPREGQSIYTPYGPVKSNKHGEELPPIVIEWLLKSNYKLTEVPVDTLSGMPFMNFSVAPGSDIHDVQSARPHGFTGIGTPQQRMAEAAAATERNTVMTMIPPQPQEVIQTSNDSFDQPPAPSTGRRGR
jgi:hypothetical protein